jgi:hypothetical protein
MNPFDDLTLGEVDRLVTDCLDGTPISDSDPIKLSGAVMFMHAKRSNPELSWSEFMDTTKMFDIKAFSELMNEDNLDPSNGAMPLKV